MSSLSNISIDRPVLAIVMSLLIIIMGIVGFNFLGVREYPSVDPPIITVSTTYAGANAEIIETRMRAESLQVERRTCMILCIPDVNSVITFQKY